MPFLFKCLLPHQVTGCGGRQRICFVMWVILIQNIILVLKGKEIGYSKANVSDYHPGTWI